jgi:hypothetical protein
MILTCKDLVEAVTDAREGHLSLLARVGYRAHLLRCRHCRAYVAQMEEVVRALRAPAAPAAPPGARAALLEMFAARKGRGSA